MANLSVTSYYRNLITWKMTFKISPNLDGKKCPAGTDFTLRLQGKIWFHPGRAGQSSIWYLLRFVQIFLCKHVLNYFFILLRQAEVINLKVSPRNFIQANRDNVITTLEALMFCSCVNYFVIAQYWTHVILWIFRFRFNESWIFCSCLMWFRYKRSLGQKNCKKSVESWSYFSLIA